MDLEHFGKSDIIFWQAEAAGHRVHEAAAQQGEHRPGDREGRLPHQEGGAAPQEPSHGGD